MTSSTRIISKDDLSKSGKMKVMNREVDGELQHGKHKVSANYDALVVDNSILDGPNFTVEVVLQADTTPEKIQSVQITRNDPTITSYRLFITEISDLDNTRSSMTYYMSRQTFNDYNSVRIFTSSGSGNETVNPVTLEYYFSSGGGNYSIRYSEFHPDSLYAYVETTKDDGVHYYSQKQLWPITP